MLFSRFTPSLYQIGTAVGLLSISAFFIALILAYAFRIEEQRSWQRFAVPDLLWIGSVLLAVSSLLLEAARRALRQAHVPAYRVRLLATLAAASLFLLLQAISGYQLLTQGVAAASNPHGSAFYLFMGFHGAHLLGGMLWLAVLWHRSNALRTGTGNDLRRHRVTAGAAAMYWHYMGALWLVLFFFLLRWTS